MIAKITGLLVLIGILFGAYFKIDTTYVRAETVKDIMQSIQKTNEKYDLEIINLRFDIIRKQVEDLEKVCTIESGCSIKTQQELNRLREDKEMLKKKMELLESK